MWTKDDYQEHMLGYLGGLQAEIERMAHASFQQRDLSELRTDFDMASERLWGLIESSDADWEGFRYPLEICCDELLHSLHYAPHNGSRKRSGLSFRAISSSVYLDAAVIQQEPETTVAVQRMLDR